MTIKPVSKGGRVQEAMTADTWNAFVRAANAHDLRSNLSAGDPSTSQENAYSTVKVHCNVGQIARREVLGFSDPSVIPSAGQYTFDNRLLFNQSAPIQGKFGLAEDAGAQDVYNTAISSGVVQCKLFVPSNGDWITRADIDPSDATRLLAKPNGSAQILWKDTGTDTTVDAIVRLANPEFVAVPGKAVGTIVAGSSTGQMEVWLNTTTQTAYLIGTGGTLAEPIYLDWMHGNLDISDGKEIIIGWFPTEQRWRVIHAECEDSGNTLNMVWNGRYQASQSGASVFMLDGPPFFPGYVMQDEGWLMVVNNSVNPSVGTYDRPAPQPMGAPTWSLPDAPTWTSNTLNQTLLWLGNKYTFTEGLWANQLRMWIPGQDSGATVEHQMLTLVDRGLSTERASFTAWTSHSAEGWISVPTGQEILAPGQTLELWQGTRSIATPSIFTGDWQYKQDNGSPASDSGEVWHQDNNYEMRFSNEDASNTDRSSDLAGVSVGATISIAGMTWTVTSVDVQPGHVRYFVEPAVRVSENTYTFTFTSWVAEDITYDWIANHWSGNDPDWATVDGYFTTNHPLNEQGTQSQNGMPTDVFIQRATASSAWDYMSFDGN